MAMLQDPQDTATVDTVASMPAQNAASAEPRPVRADAESLLRQLAQQKEATSRALQCTMEIEKRLSETREELNRALMIAAIPPDPPPRPEGGSDEGSAPDPARRAHQELEDERKARIDERVTAAAQIARLEETIAFAREKEKYARDSLKRVRIIGVAIAGTLLLAAFFLTRLAASYPGTSVARKLGDVAGSEAAPEPTPDPPASAPAAQAAEAQPSRSAPADSLAPQTSLENAVARMHRALTAFPESKPEDLIQALKNGSVKVDPKSCLLAWNDGEPELLVQDRGGNRVQIATTLAECASAIEQAHGSMILKSQPRR